MSQDDMCEIGFYTAATAFEASLERAREDRDFAKREH